MDDCCHGKAHEIAQLRDKQSRVLKIVLAINAAMFFIEFTAGVIASSTALMADSVDMLGDALVYVLSLYVIDRGTRWRAGAALAKGIIILAFGAWIAVEVVLKLRGDVTPISTLMAMFGALALAANLICLRLLWPLRSQDVNMRSTFECSRNDVISNIGVLLAAAGVALPGQGGLTFSSVRS
jgi:Co/Zn/Cd efflux system component